MSQTLRRSTLLFIAVAIYITLPWSYGRCRDAAGLMTSSLSARGEVSDAKKEPFVMSEQATAA